MPKNTVAWSHRKNARHRSSIKDVVRKAVCNKMKRKAKNEVAGWRVHGPEEDGFKWMERQSKESRGLEAHCRGGQGLPWAVAPSGGIVMRNKYKLWSTPLYSFLQPAAHSFLIWIWSAFCTQNIESFLPWTWRTDFHAHIQQKTIFFIYLYCYVLEDGNTNLPEF